VPNPRYVITAEILRVHEDDLGPYAKLRVTLADGEVIIRWGLDKYTYRHLQHLMFTQVLSVSTAPEYRCLLVLEDSALQPSAATGWVEFQFRGRRTRHSYLCSKEYLGNLRWLAGVQSAEELDGLRWERVLEYKSAPPVPPPPQQTAGRARRNGSARQVSTRKTSSSRTWIAASLGVGAVACSLGWLGLRMLADDGPKRHLSTIALAQNALPEHAHPSPDQQKSLPDNKPATPSSPRKTGSHPTTVSTHAEQDNVSPSGVNVAQVYAVPSGTVALTFDDGPSPYTEQILKVLAEHGVHATFFFISDNAQRRPEVVREAVALGNVVGNHSVDHKQLTTLSKDEQSYEITHAAEVISSLTGQPVLLFRPPYGSYNDATKEILHSNHMVLALWNRDPRDWAAHSPADVVNSVLNLPASGGVFDLHDDKYTLMALPTILDALQQQHLRFVVLGEKSVATGKPASTGKSATTGKPATTGKSGAKAPKTDGNKTNENKTDTNKADGNKTDTSNMDTNETDEKDENSH
jgi:peptidoglycan/xylan/chitin deacetylase (PgdA/CDA1 family)